MILAGLYLSKFDQAGLKELGFDGFVEAFNVIGFALGSKPASIKNYRDEFDPLFPNPRRGWHRRPTRDYCLAILERYKELDFIALTMLVRSFFGAMQERDGANTDVSGRQEQSGDSFAQRLITGLAAERYFESVCAYIPEFAGRALHNMTQTGCGYDFRLSAAPNDEGFLAVEVKGLREQVGSVSITPKEYRLASNLTDRFYLFVVRNFRESPTHDMYRNPLAAGALAFTKVERVVVQTSWVTRL